MSSRTLQSQEETSEKGWQKPSKSKGLSGRSDSPEAPKKVVVEARLLDGSTRGDGSTRDNCVGRFPDHLCV
ncbi:hypothetical protein JTB14_037872 [Gonioctena quinquepunctata]|nr:hypothetical protein JTB14_037872 [Gonioctena quinquepunctata]